MGENEERPGSGRPPHPRSVATAAAAPATGVLPSSAGAALGTGGAEETTRDRVLELFEAHRQQPGSPYEESRFLEFLLAASPRGGALRDGFRGLRRLHGFLDAVQDEFAVYSSTRDREANPSLERFVHRIEELRAKPASSLAALRSPMQARLGPIVVVAPTLLWIPALVLRGHPVPSAGLFLVGLALLIFVVHFHRREQRYLVRLHAMIQASSRARTDEGP